MMLHLKSNARDTTGMPARFAVLLEPTCKRLDIQCDEELYAVVRANGQAKLWPFEKDNPLKLCPEPETLTAQEFERDWRGD